MFRFKFFENQKSHVGKIFRLATTVWACDVNCHFFFFTSTWARIGKEIFKVTRGFLGNPRICEMERVKGGNLSFGNLYYLHIYIRLESILSGRWLIELKSSVSLFLGRQPRILRNCKGPPFLKNLVESYTGIRENDWRGVEMRWKSSNKFLGHFIHRAYAYVPFQ